MQFARKPRRSPVLNIIPLIDVLVVLLIFYIATTVFKKTRAQHQHHRAVNRARATRDAGQRRPRSIYVTKDSKIYLDDTRGRTRQAGRSAQDQESRQSRLQGLPEERRRRTFGIIVKVLDAARDAGIDDLPTYATRQHRPAAAMLPGLRAMIREIVHYDAPVLRAKGRPVARSRRKSGSSSRISSTPCAHAHGVGLAAQQIGEAMQVAVVDITGIKERPSKMWINGKPVDPEAHMPLVLINPECQADQDQNHRPRGLPELPRPDPRHRAGHACVGEDAHAGRRHAGVRAGGLLGRAILHETDHLHGKLFIDLISAEERKAIREDLEYIKRGEPIPERPDGEIDLNSPLSHPILNVTPWATTTVRVISSACASPPRNASLLDATAPEAQPGRNALRPRARGHRRSWSSRQAERATNALSPRNARATSSGWPSCSSASRGRSRNRASRAFST